MIADTAAADDAGVRKLFFSEEYSDFQGAFMEDVLSSAAFAPVIGKAEHADIVKGYLSAFLSMLKAWVENGGPGSLKDFVSYAAALFEHGIAGSR